MLTTTVTVSEFRDNLSKYIDLLVRRKKVVKLVDGRKGKIIANLVHKKKKNFDWDEYMNFVESLAGSGLLASKEDEKARERIRKATDRRLKELSKKW
jgi:hypothetical protein